MTVFRDHPVRLLRLRAGFSTQGLSQFSGVHRSTITAIEEGRPRMPDFETLAALAGPLRVDVRTLVSRVEEWAVENERPLLAPAARAALAVEPRHLLNLFPTFAVWRAQFAPSVTAFSSMLGVNRKVLSDYEVGRKRRGMPVTLSRAMLVRLDVSDEYLLAVQALPTDGEEL